MTWVVLCAIVDSTQILASDGTWITIIWYDRRRRAMSYADDRRHPKRFETSEEAKAAAVQVALETGTDAWVDEWED